MWARTRGGRWLAGVAALALAACLVTLLALSGSGAQASAARTRSRPSQPVVLLDGSPSALGSVPAHRSGHASATGNTGAATTTTTTTSTTPQVIDVGVSASPTSDPLPAGFLGFSMEFSAIHDYLGRDPSALNPVFLGLLKGVDQGTPPVLRIGGNSTDNSWVPVPGVIPPPGVDYGISRDWIATVHSLVQQTGTHLILGVNLAADDAQTAGIEARTLIDGIGRQYIEAAEIGNEPDQYPSGDWYVLPNGVDVTRRPASYGVNSYLRQFNQIRAVLPAGVRIAAGALAAPNWITNVDAAAEADRDVSMVTIHRYPLIECETNTRAPDYPTLTNLFSPAASAGIAASLAPYVPGLHGAGRQLRVDELNSAACEGAPGLSDTFASSLWMLDTLFDMAAVNVDGVNVHTLPGSYYAPFVFNQSVGGHWTGAVQPDYYGMLMFAAAFPPGARLLKDTVTNSSSLQDVQTFTTQAPNGTLRTTIVNQDPDSSADVTVTLPGPAATVRAETLTAPSLASSTGVALGGRSFAEPTSTGTLPPPVLTPVPEQNDSYDVVVAPDSAMMVVAGS